VLKILYKAKLTWDSIVGKNEKLFAAKLFGNNLTEDDLRTYQRLCERASQILMRSGKRVLPYSDTHFERLTKHRDAHRVIKCLQMWVDVLEEAEIDNESLHDTKKLVWRFLQKLQITPSADMMDALEQNDIIEIYTSDNWQVFRSLGFFDFVIATVDEIATFVWNRDSKRDSEISFEALKMVFLVKSGLLKGTFKISDSLPTHLVTCSLSRIKQVIKVKLKMASVLRSKDNQKFFLLTNKTEWVTKEPILNHH
jgi:hypothetical protein